MCSIRSDFEKRKEKEKMISWMIFGIRRCWRKFIDEFILREEVGGTKEDCKRSEFFDTVGWCGIFYTRDRMKSEKEGCGLAEATVAAAQLREIMALVTAVHL